MASRTASVDQALEIVRRLDSQGRRAVFAELSKEREIWWQEAAARGEADMSRLARERGRGWTGMTEAQREGFVDELLHEN